jgi:uncharacterized protein YyaL (SSP411 family)
VEGRPEHAEGAFYVWTKSEIDTALTTGTGTESGAQAGGVSASDFICRHFGVLEAGNVDSSLDPHGEFRGKNILHQRSSLLLTAREFGLSPEDANTLLLASLEKLRVVRARRPRPHLDDKIVTAWNGLMISALAKAHVLLEVKASAQPDQLSAQSYLERAVRAAEFIEKALFDPARGRLYRSYRDGRGQAEGFAEDYAFFIQGLIDLYEASFELRWLQWALQLQATMDTLFWDNEGGGYFNSSGDDQHIILRLKEDYDGAEPAPGSIAASNLLRLAPFSGAEADFRRKAERTIEAAKAQWERAPQALPQMLCALELVLAPASQVVLVGQRDAADFKALAAVLHEKMGARRVVLALDGGDDQRWLGQRAPWLEAMTSIDGKATAYVCEHYQCQSPVTDPSALRSLLT